ncbi:MAG: GumC family protein [Candidatus Krumholzibacteriia bacterium]
MLDLLRILLHWRRPLVAFAFLAAAVTAGVSFTLTPRYYSQASILPPHDNPGFGGISSLLQQYQVPVPGGIATPFLPTLYAAIVGSRKMATRILDEFELRPVFRSQTEAEAVETLRRRTFLKYTEEGILLVGYEDPDARRAADVVNAYVRYLDEFIQKVNSSRAGDTRVFVAEQVQRCGADLGRAEEDLRDFQLGHRAIEIDEQTRGALEIAAEIQARILATEIELDLLRQHAQPTAYEVRSKAGELRALREQFARLVATEPTTLESQPLQEESVGLFHRFDEVPELALQYMRLLREVKVQTTLYTMLLQQLEQARIEEAKNTRVLSILDPAVPGEQPVFPRRLRMIAVAALAAFVWVAICAVFVEKLIERREDAAEAARLSALRREWNRMPGWVRSLERLVVK